MKKIFILVFLVLLFGYYFFSIDLDYKNFKIEAKNIENEELRNDLKNFLNKTLEETKNEFKETKKSGNLAKKPSLSANLSEYKDNGIKTYILNIYKNIKKENDENILKNFYLNENGEKIDGKNIFKIDEKNIKNFEEKFVNKLKFVKGFFSNEDNLKNSLKKYFENMIFYFENNKIVFLFQTKDFGKIEKNISEVEFYFHELKYFLNPDFFPEIKKELEKKAREEKLKQLNKQKKNFSENDKKIFNNGKKYVALTFDDGPSNLTTPRLLDILKEENVKATFFVLGKMVAAYPEILKREFEEGHEIASHSWSHPNLITLSEANIKKQVEQTDKEIEKVIGITPNLLRPPYGAHNKKIDNIIGKTIVMWDVDSLDWKHKNAEKNISTTIPQISNGSIILFHDIHKTSVDSIPSLIKNLKNKGYEFLTVSELLEIGQEGDFEKKVCFSEFNCYNY